MIWVGNAHKLKDNWSDDNTDVSISSWLAHLVSLRGKIIYDVSIRWVLIVWQKLHETQKQNRILYGCIEFYIQWPWRTDADAEWTASECWSMGYSQHCAEIQDWSVINGRGRAPLIVVPDTGTRPQTKQDRAGAGCHAQSPSSRKPWVLLRGGGVRRKERSRDIWWWQ